MRESISNSILFGAILSICICNNANSATTFLPDYDDHLNNYSRTGLNFAQDNDCFSEGYTITSCPVGSILDPKSQCPYELNSAFYKNCMVSCPDAGYVKSCTSGYVPDTSDVCTQDDTYTKCKCSPCEGYTHTLLEANEAGFLPDGPPCLSCEQELYKRKPNPCNGFEHDETNCGKDSCGKLEGETCQSGEVVKYKSCKPCLVSCPAGQINFEAYWCKGALSCWWPKN